MGRSETEHLERGILELTLTGKEHIAIRYRLNFTNRGRESFWLCPCFPYNEEIQIGAVIKKIKEVIEQ